MIKRVKLNKNLLLRLCNLRLPFENELFFDWCLTSCSNAVRKNYEQNLIRKYGQVYRVNCGEVFFYTDKPKAELIQLITIKEIIDL